MSDICDVCGAVYTGVRCENPRCARSRVQSSAKSSAKSSDPGALTEVVGGAVMCAGAYLLAVFAGFALHVLKNGPGDGSMPSLGVSGTFVIVGLIACAAGCALARNWLRNPRDPVSSFELFSVLICDPVPFCIGIYYLFQRRSRGARLLLTHSLIIFVKFAVAAVAWNPNL